MHRLLPESPRWLLVNKKYERAERAIRWIAKWNRKQLEADFDVREIEVVGTVILID